VKSENFKKIFIIYLSLLFLIAVYYLFDKHTGGTDSTISEWLINYQGGFTKRGLIGEICFLIAKYFDLSLRFVIFLFQSFIYLIFLVLIYRFFKNIPTNLIIILSIFSPILLLYHVAEIEILARKEIFVFIGLLLFLNISNFNYSSNLSLCYVFFILPIICLIWEPIVFFFPFIASVLIIRLNNNQIMTILSKTIIAFIPALTVFLIIITNPLTAEEHLIMANSLKENFGEACYMSCGLLKSKSLIIEQFTGNISAYSLEIFIRYFLIVLIGFAPIFLLCLNTKLKIKVLFFQYFNNLLSPVLIILLPVLIMFSAMADWGRIVNISYTFTVLFYFYLFQNKLLEVNFEKIAKKISFIKDKKYLLVLCFIIYAFGWNPKTTLVGDIGSIPGYRVPYKLLKHMDDRYGIPYKFFKGIIAK